VIRIPRRLAMAVLAVAMLVPAMQVVGITSASATTQQDIAALASANIGKGAGYCSTANSADNSLGGDEFETSCTGNNGAPEFWCADFAMWVWQNASGGTIDISGLNAGAGSFYTYGEANGTLHTSASYKPQVGDAVVYDFSTDYDNTGEPGANHVGLVTAVNSNGSIVTANGDFGGTSQVESTFAEQSTVMSVTIAASQEATGDTPSGIGMTISGYVTPVGLTGTAAGGLAAPAVAVNGSDQDVVFRGGNGDIYEDHWNNATGNWSALDLCTQVGKATCDVSTGASVAVETDNDQYVVFVGSTGDLYEFYYDATSSPPAWSASDECTTNSWGCSASYAPSIAVDAAGDQDVVYVGSNSEVYEAHYNAAHTSGTGWSIVNECTTNSWGCTVISPAAVALDSAGDQDIVYEGSNGDVYEAHYNAAHTSGTGWSTVNECTTNNWGCSVSSGPNIASVDSAGDQDVVYEGSNGHVYEDHYNAGHTSGTGWTAVDECATNSWGCSPASAPAVALNTTTGNQDVVYEGSNADIYEAQYVDSDGTWAASDECTTNGWGCGVS
jgi:hypothetical protein